MILSIYLSHFDSYGKNTIVHLYTMLIFKTNNSDKNSTSSINIRA